MTEELMVICGMRCNSVLVDIVRNSPSKEWRTAARKVIRMREKKFGYKVL